MPVIKLKIDLDAVRIIQTRDGGIYLAELLPIGYLTLEDPRRVFLPNQIRSAWTPEELTVRLRRFEALIRSAAHELSWILSDSTELLGDK